MTVPSFSKSPAWVTYSRARKPAKCSQTIVLHSCASLSCPKGIGQSAFRSGLVVLKHSSNRLVARDRVLTIEVEPPRADSAIDSGSTAVQRARCVSSESGASSEEVDQ